jgi:outer membrane protein W
MYSYNKYDEYYIAYSGWFSPQGPVIVFPYSFNLRTEWIRHRLNLYIGAGADIVIWKNLYANISGGFGWMFQSSKFIYTNITTGNVEHESTEDLKESGGSWMASFGIGYRF